MATQSPFSFLRNLAGNLGSSMALPSWLVEEVQRRFVLTVNHVLQQEPQAQERLATQTGKAVYISWRQFNAQVRITPAGLLELDDTQQASDLLLEVTEPSVTKLTRAALDGTRPSIRIAGDVALASQINWVIDNVRWDVEDDLARIIGDVPAHKLSQVGRKLAEEVRKFVQGAMSTFDGFAQKTGTGAPATAPAAAPAQPDNANAANNAPPAEPVPGQDGLPRQP